MHYFRNKDGSFMNKEEAARSVFNLLSKEDKQVLSFCPREMLHTYHAELGTAIRNAFGFWISSNPHTLGGTVHPDDYSLEVLEIVHDYITGQRNFEAEVVKHVSTKSTAQVEEVTATDVYNAVQARFKALLGR